MGILNFPEIIVSDVNYIADQGGTIQDIADYLYEYHGYSVDVHALYSELNEALPAVVHQQQHRHPTAGVGVKGHFKKHWKKYAAGAAVVGAGALGMKARSNLKHNKAAEQANLVNRVRSQMRSAQQNGTYY